jgi:Cu/Ag efflux protein CusF
MKKMIAVLIAAVLSVATLARAAEALTDGEVRKIDKDAAKLTIKHGPISNLDMPGMTMVFRVKDPAMLNQVKKGDKIQFQAENVNGALTVTQIKSAK